MEKYTQLILIGWYAEFIKENFWFVSILKLFYMLTIKLVYGKFI